MRESRMRLQSWRSVIVLILIRHVFLCYATSQGTLGTLDFPWCLSAALGEYRHEHYSRCPPRTATDEPAGRVDVRGMSNNIGYARFSTTDQSADLQVDAPTVACAMTIFTDQARE